MNESKIEDTAGVEKILEFALLVILFLVNFSEVSLASSGLL